MSEKYIILFYFYIVYLCSFTLYLMYFKISQIL